MVVTKRLHILKKDDTWFTCLKDACKAKKSADKQTFNYGKLVFNPSLVNDGI